MSHRISPSFPNVFIRNPGLLRIIICIFVFSLILTPTILYATTIGFGGMRGEFEEDVSQPRIISPGDKVDLTGKDTLEFRWYSYMRSTSMNGGYFDLRIFKGTDMYESNMILKQQVDYTKDRVEVDAKLFEPGQVYSWELRFVKYDLKKSDWVYETFRVSP